MTHKVTNAVRRLGARRLSLAMIAIALVVWVIVVTGLGDFRSDRYSSISITGQNSCGLRTDGSVVCWGYSSALAPMGERFIDVAVGSGHGCGLREDGSIACWGHIRFSPNTYSVQPSDEIARGPYKQVVAGGTQICALGMEGRVVCWGASEYGEKRPCISKVSDDAPTGVCWGPRGWGIGPPDDERFTTISLGQADGCGLREDGSVVCWGDRLSGVGKCNAVNPSGQGVCWAHIPEKVVEHPDEDERFKAVSVGPGFACAIRIDDDIRCWGAKEYSPASNYPHVEGPFTDVSSGVSHVCGLRPDGTVYCFGSSSSYENADFGDAPVRRDRFVSISSGRNYNCGLREDGTAKCWGGTWLNRAEPKE